MTLTLGKKHAHQIIRESWAPFRPKNATTAYSKMVFAKYSYHIVLYDDDFDLLSQIITIRKFQFS